MGENELTVQVLTSSYTVRRIMREGKNGSYPKRDDATYSRKEDKHRQSEMRGKNHRKVNRSVLYDRPDDPREPESSLR